ncbi:hypothetical protein PMAYCL1PPCAC_00997, partial [Pristionchus mayeri]
GEGAHFRIVISFVMRLLFVLCILPLAWCEEFQTTKSYEEEFPALGGGAATTTRAPTTTTRQLVQCEQPIPNVEPKLKDFMGLHGCKQIQFALTQLKDTVKANYGFELKDDDPDVMAFMKQWQSSQAFESHAALVKLLNTLSQSATTTVASATINPSKEQEFLNVYGKYTVFGQQATLINFLNDNGGYSFKADDPKIKAILDQYKNTVINDCYYVLKDALINAVDVTTTTTTTTTTTRTLAPTTSKVVTCADGIPNVEPRLKDFVATYSCNQITYALPYLRHTVKANYGFEMKLDNNYVQAFLQEWQYATVYNSYDDLIKLLNTLEGVTTTTTAATTTTNTVLACQAPIPNADPKLKSFLDQYSCYQVKHALAKLKEYVKANYGVEMKDDDPNVKPFVDKYGTTTTLIYDAYQDLKQLIDTLAPTTTAAALTTTNDQLQKFLNAYGTYRVRDENAKLIDFLNSYYGHSFNKDDPVVKACLDYNGNTFIKDSYATIKDMLASGTYCGPPTTTTFAPSTTTDSRTGEFLNAYSYYRINEKEQLVLDYINGYGHSFKADDPEVRNCLELYGKDFIKDSLKFLKDALVTGSACPIARTTTVAGGRSCAPFTGPDPYGSGNQVTSANPCVTLDTKAVCSTDPAQPHCTCTYTFKGDLCEQVRDQSELGRCKMFSGDVYATNRCTTKCYDCTCDPDESKQWCTCTPAWTGEYCDIRVTTVAPAMTTTVCCV